MSELDALDPLSEQVKLTSGTVVVIEDLRARQFFKLLRIVTHGTMQQMTDMSIFRLDPSGDQDEFALKLLSLMVLSIPDAEQETIEFIASMCKPVGLIERRGLNNQDKERNAALWRRLDDELENPELDDLITIVEVVVRREAADIQALGKRLAAMFNLAAKTGQLSPSTTSSMSTSSAGSAAPSTSSQPSMDGPMTSSLDSLLNDSGSASPQSESDGSTPSGSVSNG